MHDIGWVVAVTALLFFSCQSPCNRPPSPLMQAWKTKAKGFLGSKNSHGTKKSPPLTAQHLTLASADTKIRLAILATALVDALGGPAEFHDRFSFPLVTTMIPNDNFSLPPGVWTDDTSMTLCLARSLATFNSIGGFDERNQLDAYNSWHQDGTLSAIGRCFDIGNTIKRALHIHRRHQEDETIDEVLQHISRELEGENSAGNGSLMRILPIGLAYWRNEGGAIELGRRSSRTTHPNLLCQEACAVWTRTIAWIMRASTENKSFDKLDVVKSFAEYPYENDKLRSALALPSGIPPLPTKKGEQEIYYHAHHPILRLIAKVQAENISKNTARSTRGGFSKKLPDREDLPSSGYVLHTLVAALYCFLATETFEEGAIMAVNLGDDADTVGAVYAGLAGCWYAGAEGDDKHGMFWTERVKEWQSKLVERELVEEVANELASYATKLSL